MISKIIRDMYIKKLVSCNYRAQGKFIYRYYLIMCIFFLSKPFGFLFYKRRALRCLKSKFSNYMYVD